MHEKVDIFNSYDKGADREKIAGVKALPGAYPEGHG